MDEPALIRQILAGDRQAFRVLVVRYQRPVFRFLSTFRLTPAQREELAQEAFLRAFVNLPAFDFSKGTAFSSWLFTIVKNMAINQLGRASQENEQLVAVPPDSDDLFESSSPAEQAQRRSLVQRALAGLPQVFRNAVAFAYLDELSLEEIAAIEKCSVGTVKSRIFRGKQLLRAALAGGEV